MAATKVQISDSFAQIITWKYHFYSRCLSVCSEHRKAFFWNNLACRLVYRNWTIRFQRCLIKCSKYLLGNFAHIKLKLNYRVLFSKAKHISNIISFKNPAKANLNKSSNKTKHMFTIHEQEEFQDP